MHIDWKRQPPVFEAKDLDEAYKLGYYEQSMSRWRLLELLRKRNRGIHYKNLGKYAGFYNDKEFICGASPHFTIPRYSIVKYDKTQDRRASWSTPDGVVTSREVINDDEEKGKILVRGWETTLKILKQKGFDIRSEDIS